MVDWWSTFDGGQEVNFAMKLETLTQNIQSQSPDRQKLQRAALATARFAVQQQREKLRELTVAWADAQPEDAWSQGFVEALRLVSRVLDNASTRKAASQELAALATSSDWRRMIPYLGSWTQPGELARKLEMDKAQVSRALGSMKSNSVVEWIQGESDKRSRLYRLTSLGREVAQSAGLPILENTSTPASAENEPAEDSMAVLSGLQEALELALEDGSIDEREAEEFVVPRMIPLVRQLNHGNELVRYILAAGWTQEARMICSQVLSEDMRVNLTECALANTLLTADSSNKTASSDSDLTTILGAMRRFRLTDG